MIIFKRLSQGFSLLEILISLVIVSIIALFSIQGISDFFEHRKQRVYMQQLYHDLKWARAEAVALNTLVMLQANQDWCAGWEMRSNSQVLKHREGIKNYCKIIFSGSLSATSFQFAPDGSSNYQNGHFYFYDHEKVTMKIIVNQLGRVRWES